MTARKLRHAWPLRTCQACGDGPVRVRGLCGHCDTLLRALERSRVKGPAPLTTRAVQAARSPAPSLAALCQHCGRHPIHGHGRCSTCLTYRRKHGGAERPLTHLRGMV